MGLLQPQRGVLLIFVTSLVGRLPQASCHAQAQAQAQACTAAADRDATSSNSNSDSLCRTSTAASGLEKERQEEENLVSPAAETASEAASARPLALLLLQRASASSRSRRHLPPPPALPLGPKFEAFSTLQTLERLVARANASLLPRASRLPILAPAPVPSALHAARVSRPHAATASRPGPGPVTAYASAGGMPASMNMPPRSRSQLQLGLLALHEGILLGEAKAARREAERLRREEGELRRQNVQLHRALQRGTPTPAATGGKQPKEEDEEDLEDLFGAGRANSTESEPHSSHSSQRSHYSLFSSRLFWVVAVGAVTLLVLCTCFWVLECTYFKNFDTDGDGEVEMEEVMINMKRYMSVSWTTLRASGVCMTVSGTVFTLLWWAGIIQLLFTQMLVYVCFAVAMSSGICIFMYHIYLNITSMMGTLFKDVKDMIQGVINFLEEKAEAAAEEMEKLTGTMGILAQDSPGMYVIKSRCDLQKSEKLDSQVIQQLEEDMLVNVMKVKTRLGDSRIRGLVESPKGWISIQNMETGFRWADKKEYQRGYFKVVADSLAVTTDVELNSPPAFKHRIEKGDVVRVNEVRHRMREGAVRGHIADGWITLLDLRTSRHNVEPWRVRGQSGIVPGLAALGSCGTAGPRRQASAEDAPEGDEAPEDFPGLRDVGRDPFLVTAT